MAQNQNAVLTKESVRESRVCFCCLCGLLVPDGMKTCPPDQDCLSGDNSGGG